MDFPVLAVRKRMIRTVNGWHMFPEILMNSLYSIESNYIKGHTL